MREYLPLDPDCPVVSRAHQAQAEDPMWSYAGIEEEWWEDFRKRHFPVCEQCRTFGVENIEVR